MPPAVWNKDSFSGILSELIACKVAIVSVVPNRVSTTFDPRQNVHEIVNGLIVFVWMFEALSFDHVFRNMRRKQDPALFAVNQRVPGTGGERVNMNSRS